MVSISHNYSGEYKKLIDRAVSLGLPTMLDHQCFYCRKFDPHKIGCVECNFEFNDNADLSIERSNEC